MARVFVATRGHTGLVLGPVAALFLIVGLILYATIVVVIAAVMVAGWAIYQTALAIERRRMRRVAEKRGADS